MFGEVIDEGAGAWVGEEAAHLAFEDGWGVERVACCGIEQFVVGDTAPEKERETRGELDVGDAVAGARGYADGILLYAEEEFGADEDGPQGHFDCAIERVGGTGLLVETERGAEVGVIHGTAVGATQES